MDAACDMKIPVGYWVQQVKANGETAAVLNATGSQRVGPWHAGARLTESDLQQVADLVVSSHRT